MRLVHILTTFILFCSGFVYAQTFSIEDKTFSAKFAGSYFEFNEPVTDIDKAYKDLKKNIGVTEHKKNKRKYSKEPMWLAFTVKNHFAIQLERIIQFPFGCTDEMELYVFRKDGTYKKIHKKHSTPLKEREYEIRRLSAGLFFEAGEEKLIIAKLVSSHQLSAGFDIYSIDQAFTYEENYKTISLLYVGIALGLLLYNFFVGFSSKKKSIYLYMGALFLLSTLIMVTADIPAYFGIVIPKVFHDILPLHRAILISVMTYFTLSFLRVKRIMPKTHKAFNIFAIFTIVMGAISLTGQHYNLVNMILKNLMTANLVMIMGLACYVSIKTKSRPAFLFTLATASLFISGIIYMLTWSFGIIPRNFMTANIILLGSAVEMVLFSLAIADSFKSEITKEFEERIKAEKELKNLNNFLEKKVKDKTDELLASKKRAALGELATGVAHEMNSPLSAVFNNLQYLSAVLEKEQSEFNIEKAKKLSLKGTRIINEIFEITNKLKSFGESYGDVKQETVDIDAVVKSIISSFDNSTKQKKVFYVEEKGIFVNIYKAHLFNVLSSLTSIATQFNETTFISLDTVGDLIEFEISGAHKEIPDWIRNYLKFPFYEHSGEVKGSGLELSMAKDAIEAMNGKIIVSNLNEDFIFKIQIPYSKEKNKKAA